MKLKLKDFSILTKKSYWISVFGGYMVTFAFFSFLETITRARQPLWFYFSAGLPIAYIAGYRVHEMLFPKVSNPFSLFSIFHGSSKKKRK